ncbi:MAG: cysteine desulfurase-like protein [Anaerolineales bacterium]
MTFDTEFVRKQFPSLKSGAVFFDNPGGTQIAKPALDRLNAYLLETNANHGGAFPTSEASDAILQAAHQAMADLLNAHSPDEIIFGPNMTTLTLSLSRAIGSTLNVGDELVVTRLDHDANISPWLRVAEDSGATVRWVDFDTETCTLSADSLAGAINDRTRLVAVGYASNAVGTINPVADIVRLAHEAGALCFVDAVQYAPHRLIDVQALDCDFLAVSAYKFFGPHVGALYGKRDLLESIPAYKVRPAPDQPPGKFETGTQNHEGIAGTLGAIEYLADLGHRFGESLTAADDMEVRAQRRELKAGMATIEQYERQLTAELLEALAGIPEAHVYGLTDLADLNRRVPTVSFRLQGIEPRTVASALGQMGVYVWDGNFYALAVTERLELEESGGLIRVGLAHYNTSDEIDQLADGLHTILAG